MSPPILSYGIVGGGIAGLTAALDARRLGHEVTVFEAAPVLGGLASSFEFHDAWIDRYYHFICGGDRAILELVGELGIKARLHWRPSRTYQYAAGRLHPFNGASDLLRFDAIPLRARLRFGAHAAACRFIKDWRSFDHRTGADWLGAWLGREAYEAVWGPLLRSKFGQYADEISAPWMWNRIHRLGSSRRHLWSPEMLGYLEEGSKPLFDALGLALDSAGARTELGAKVDSIAIEDGRACGLVVGGERRAFDRIVAAVPLPVTARMLPAPHAELARSLLRVRYIGVVCVLLLLDRPLTDGFWVNINDPRVSMSGFIEYTNLDPLPKLGGKSLVYVPYYVSDDSPVWASGDPGLLEQTLVGLEQLLPAFRRSQLVDYRVFRDRWAQAVCTAGFASLVPPVATGVRGLFVLDSTQLYPADRSRSGMIGLVRDHGEVLFR